MSGSLPGVKQKESQNKKRPALIFAAVLTFTFPLTASDGQNANSEQQIGDKCSKLSTAVEHKKSNDSILTIQVWRTRPQAKACRGSNASWTPRGKHRGHT